MEPPAAATAKGPLPTGKVPRLVPFAADSFVTVLLDWLVTQTFWPSKASPCGRPVGNVPSRAPSEARSLLTLSLRLLATQMVVPVAPIAAKTATGRRPTGMVPRTAPSLARNLVTELLN